ncbi:hypothetical protein OFM36_32970, partial [Escherichia coli]|nr:hypothetical protein [Escherichia coli]
MIHQDEKQLNEISLVGIEERDINKLLQSITDSLKLIVGYIVSNIIRESKDGMCLSSVNHSVSRIFA